MAETPETVEVNVVMGAQTRAIVRSALIHVKNKLGERQAEGPATGGVVDIIDEELVNWPMAVEPEAPDTLPEWLYNRFAPELLGLVRSAKPAWKDADQAYWTQQAAAVRRAVGRGGFKSAKRDRMNLVLSTPINELHQVAKGAQEGGGAIEGLRPLDLKNAETLGEAIRIAVGAASTCWTNLIGAGVFKSEEALDIATQLEHHFVYLRSLSMGQMDERHQALGEMLRNYLGTGNPAVSAQQVYNILCGQSRPEEYGSALQERVNQPAPKTPGFDGPEGETTGWKAT